jgi:hypothetical protein
MTNFKFETPLHAEHSPIRFWVAVLGQKIRYLIGYSPIEKRELNTHDDEKTTTWGAAQKPFVCAAPAADHRFSLAIHGVTSAVDAAQLSSDSMTREANSVLRTVSSPPAAR